MRAKNGGGRILSLLAGVALLVCAFGAAPARADAVIRVGKAFAGVFDFVPLDVGMDEGIFKKHGLEIKESEFSGSAKIQQALAADSIDVALSSGVELAYVARGAPVMAVADFMGPPADLALLVRNEPGLRTVKDLKGKRISVSTVSSLTEWMVQQVSIQEGWGTHGIVTVPLGARAAQVAILRTGQTDGMAIDFVGGVVLERKGIGHMLLYFDQFVPDFITHAIFARNAFIQQHPDELRAFLAGWFETIHYMRGHKAQTVKIAAKVMHEPADIIAEDYDRTMPAFSTTGRFEPKALMVLRRSFTEMGLLTHVPDMKTLYTEKFLPQHKPG